MDLVRFDYNQIKQLIQRAADESDVVSQTTDRVITQLDVLQNGAWTGENAQKFYADMEQILIGLNRLSIALSSVSEGFEQAGSVFQSAEDEASSLFS
ncbi:MAG: WXG100 family type VII secretion target [Anaerolineae bacterium]|nr:WXG100 family type VII secretion target [Anaerolineae bacterium]